MNRLMISAALISLSLISVADAFNNQKKQLLEPSAKTQSFSLAATTDTEKATDKVKVTGTNTKKTTKANNAAKKATTFKPSETISEDLSVSFPVDI
ncbi:hypothetical protein [Psychrobium sp. 1_MG-2023]|uniref:hypothetical protein n=1 Tax=Psychrobium sp. 1_MG-2023 TaxID=3062624 RepID=UPI000C3480EC|nr:hypothetical protein [Psychrobium sp. 1_MG-2023]MDP2562578.1 hypothetical protein [Psychrobium sp. 1_MG-2023]PKF59655.1 hypothetical protein CW748_00135 [Alteromonadales bacterium alter-6D02]